MADNRNTLTDEILVLAETLGDIKARFERVEAEFDTQSKPLEAALAALSAAMTGIKTLQHHVLDNSLASLSAKVEEQRKAIDEQITVLVGELKGADQQNAEKIALQTAELKTQFAGITDSVRQLSSQFEAQIKRVELEAKQELTKFAAVPGPQGPAGASINPRGNWIDGVTYNRLDVVSLLGTSYISAVDGNTSKPTKGDKWTILARSGTGGGGAGNFGSLAGVAEITQGGTGQTTALAGARALLDGISTTRGTVLYRGSDGWTALTPGSADQVLKTQGAGADPAWGSTTSSTAATNAQAAAGTSTTTFITPANAEYAVAPVVNGRSPRQGLVFDGTAGATVSVPAFGTSGWTQAFWVYQTQIRGGGQLTYLSGSNGATAPNVAFLDTTNQLLVYNGSSAFYSGYIVPTGKWLNIVVTNNGTTTTFYSNGVQVGSTSDSTNYSGTLVAIGSNGSTNSWLYGTLSGCLIYNRALSSSEVVALYEAGAPAGADYPSQVAGTALLTGNNSTFASGVGTWQGVNGGSIVSSGGVGVVTTTGGYVGAGTENGLLKKGTRYRLTFTSSNYTGSVTGIFFFTSDGTIYGTGNYSPGTYTVDFTANASGSSSYLGFSTASSSGGFSLDNVTITPLGLLLAPDAYQAGNGLVWTDMSGNGAQIVLPTSGVSWNVPGTGQTRIRGTTSTNGNQQLLGASTYLGNTHITRMRARSRTGTPTITIGASSGTSGYVSSTALNQYWQNLTIANNLPASPGAIWIGSNSTDVVEVDCDIEPLSF